MLNQLATGLIQKFDSLRSATEHLGLADIFQVLIIVGLFLVFYKVLIKNTSSEKLVKGILSALVSFWVFSWILATLDLMILSGFFKSLIVVVILSLVVIFQPELRRFLGYLGQGGFLNKNFYLGKKYRKINKINVTKELMNAIKHLKKTRTGALIVIQKDDSETGYSEVGTKINGLISTELLLTIFHPNTPLHDGAVLIREDRIIAAGVLLPLTEDPKLSWRYGTRHRAAIGMSEISNSACLVVSEETGEISVAMDGILKKYDDAALLKTDLENLLENDNFEGNSAKNSIFGMLKNKIDTDKDS